ncbi:hypothetical protein PB2503_08964 [Parvularcula bermudensis HTCC2503]|uniref:Uncharacterized protein n=1 Tax=Parvularcula bermudensis (strain ATCC BAA-594 / HTCC2503 / KCTC 12087) TaxID=314260 RepID=E0TCF6_PARBH|nr:hypothetical protein PB2503_08964 [Parvularcula bermudensis HTCC2503]
MPAGRKSFCAKDFSQRLEFD